MCIQTKMKYRSVSLGDQVFSTNFTKLTVPGSSGKNPKFRSISCSTEIERNLGTNFTDDDSDLFSDNNNNISLEDRVRTLSYSSEIAEQLALIGDEITETLGSQLNNSVLLALLQGYFGRLNEQNNRSIQDENTPKGKISGYLSYVIRELITRM